MILSKVNRTPHENVNQRSIVFGQGNELARYVGSIGDLDSWVYNDRYVDEQDRTQKNFVCIQTRKRKNK